MSDLLPCPVCAKEGSRMVSYECGGIFWSDRECNHCEFRCDPDFWDELPRTRWVSVSERLPDDGRFKQIQFSDESCGNASDKMLLWRPELNKWNDDSGNTNFYEKNAVSYWLDALPTPPPTAEGGVS